MRSRVSIAVTGALVVMALAVSPRLSSSAYGAPNDEGAGARLDDESARRRVWMKGHRVAVRIDGFLVHTTETLSFQGGWGADEYIYTFKLPKDGALTGLSYVSAKKGSASSQTFGSALLDARAVRQKISNRYGLPKQSDPVWVEQVDRGVFRLRMVPPRSGAVVTVKLEHIHPVGLNWGRRVYRYPRLGRDKRFWPAVITVRDRPPGHKKYRIVRKRLSPRKEWRLVLARHRTTGAPVNLNLFVEPSPKTRKANGARAGGGRKTQHCGPKQSAAGGGVVMAALLGRGFRKTVQRTHLVLVVDTSKSMWKHSRLHVNRLLSALLSEVGGKSRFQLIAFDRNARAAFAHPVQVTPANASKAKKWLKKQSQNNGTDPQKALRLAFAQLKKAHRGRRLVVLVTDGLLSEKGRPTMNIKVDAGIELVAVLGRRWHRAVWELDSGPLADLAHGSGALAYGMDPYKLQRATKRKQRRKKRTPARSGSSGKAGLRGGSPKASTTQGSETWRSVARRIARPGRLTHIELIVDGKTIPLAKHRRQLSTGSGFIHMWRYRGQPPQRALLKYSYAGRWRRTGGTVTRMVRSGKHAAQAGPLEQLLTVRELDALGEKEIFAHLRAQRKADSAQKERKRIQPKKRWRRLWRAGRVCALDAGVVSWATSRVVTAPQSAFSRDRLRFARRWGHRFFRRLAPKNAPHLPVSFAQRKDTTEVPVKVLNTGALSKSVVLRVLKRGYLKAAKACYQNRVGLGATSTRLPRGRVVLALELTRGEVVRGWLEKNELADAKLEKCLVQAAYKLSIPRAKRDRTLYRILYPLRFRLDKRTVEILKNAGYRPKVRAAENPLEGF